MNDLARYCLDLPNSAQIIGNWVYNWQTLISGLLALAAAGIAACLLNKQIKQADKLADDARDKKFMAARCLLPVHLAEVDDYCERVVDELNSLLIEEVETSGTVLNLSSKIQFPSQSIVHMSTVLEFTISDCLAKLIAKIIGDLQVLQSSIAAVSVVDLKKGPNRTPPDLEPSTVEHYIIQAGTIGVMVSSLYEYARQEKDVLPDRIEWNTVYRKFRSSNIPPEMRKRMNAYLDYRTTIGPIFKCQ